jgi:hypothetical protein
LDDWLYWRLIHSQLGTTGNYSAIPDLHTLQFTVTHSRGFSDFTSRILTTDFITVSQSHQITHEVSFSQPNSFLAIILQLLTQFNSSAPNLISWQAGVSKLGSPQLNSSLHGPRGKHSLFIVGKACLQRRCIATEVTRFLLAYLLLRGICLPSRCLRVNVYSDFTIPALGRHVAIPSCILVTQIIRNSIVRNPAVEFCDDRNKAPSLTCRNFFSNRVTVGEFRVKQLSVVVHGTCKMYQRSPPEWHAS